MSSGASRFFSNLKNFFPFRSRVNFSITVLGVGSTGYFLARYYTDQKFEHPLVKESMRILRKNQQILELVGYPFSIKSAVRATAVINEKDAFFMFVVKGPKGYITIDLQGKAAEFKELRNDSNKDQLFREYNILDPETRELVQKIESDEEKSRLAVPDEAKFWKIEYIYADLGGQYRIVVLPEQQSTEQQKTSEQVKQDSRQAYPYYGVTDRLNLRDLEIEEQVKWKEVTGETGPQSEVEMEEMRKFRTQELYRKIGYVRFYMFLIFLGGGMSIYVYIQKNRRKNIVGSQIHIMAKHIIQSSPYIQKHIGQQLRFSQSLRGAQIDLKADFEQDFFAQKGSGIAKIKGTVDSKTSVWNIDSIDVELKDLNGKPIDKKKLL